ncbi:hypothetical protein PT974_01122 [Cladobotryum mycophilum]|uniref:Fatty acyl-CoA reductase n=1 Tax=Cladobotryum mycophilum TaxID=491253 RepID=A0ABR0T2S9_9HYPO
MIHNNTNTLSGLTSFYDDRSVFVTGGTGMVGMVYLSRLALDTPVKRVYVLVRGGEDRFWDFIPQHLPIKLVDRLRDSGKLVILDGDMTKPNCNLTQDALDDIRRDVSIVVHCACDLNLKKKLSLMVDCVLNPTCGLSKMALECANLDLFVFVSTAFSSTFLRKGSDGKIVGYDARIKEDVNHIRAEMTLDAELADLEAFGDTPEYSFVKHPFAYSYAKHLTERCLLRDFAAIGKSDKLMVFRPSIIGPAESFPYPFYEKPGSAPLTTMAALNIVCPPTKSIYSSHFSKPKEEVFYDEIPVDIVVNRMIAHVAARTTSIVHAWRDVDWKADELCLTSKLFVLMGCNFLFEDTKTERLWESMSQVDREDWPLWASSDAMNAWHKDNVEGRKKAVRILVGQILKKKLGVSPAFTKLFCR